MKTVDLGGVDYIGASVVKPLIERNQAAYGSPTRRFVHLDLTSNVLPKADLLFCRDRLFHLSFAQIAATLMNFRRSGSTWLLTATHPASTVNVDIKTGEFRSL